ncbi:growth/differentiation factor 15 [Eublepharis macularius]|uniref:Growth/differentiation factor 15 n=1 Tax=Eublepharis macularius TaxID=481883 RepID=A0AA97JI19_EUBMA|nr:growth/differentiation factor 15 [Eublepharis macularius]
MMPRLQWSTWCLSRDLAVVVAVLLLLLLSGVDPRPHGGHASQLHLEGIKRSILEWLGLDRPPVLREALDQDMLRRSHRVYREMLAQLRMNQTAGPEPPPAEPAPTIHLLRPKLKQVAEGPPKSLEVPGEPHGPLHSLELSRTAALRRDLLVLRAELRLFQQALNHSDIPNANSAGPTHVNIYKLVDGNRWSPRLLASYVLSRTSLTLDLRDAVAHWITSPERRLLLGLEFSTDVTSSLATTTTLEGTKTLSLEVTTQERVRVRKARQLDEECGKADGKCCLRSLKVSFEAIGWSDWVVAPSSYSMKFCEGSCPHNYKPASIHAQIKARVHSLSGETPAPCCVPAAYEPMVIMLIGTEGKLVTKLFQDMIVTRCHCA